MKCKDLTISDYVKHDGAIKIVDAVYLYSVSVHDPSEEWSISEAKTYSIDDIEPIGLTEEILVKNGFHTYGESYFIPEDKCNAHVRIGFHYRETVVDLHRHGAFSIQISYKPGMLYVHTLQHLLRERGIDKEIEL